MTETPDHRAAEAAACRYGIITREQALASGLNDEQIRWRLRAGRWRLLHRGVYAIAGATVTWPQGVYAAVVAAGTNAVVSHHAAAKLHRLLDRAPELAITVPTRCGPRVKGARIVRTRCLPDVDRTSIGGIPVTTGARTLIDLAGVLEPRRLVALADDAICKGVTTRHALFERASALKRGRAGVAPLVDLAAPDSRARFNSILERDAAALFSSGGLPEPEWNVAVRDASGRIGVVDVLFRATRVVIELDGLRYHRDRSQERSDRSRDRRLQLAGYTVLRFTWSDIHDRPDLVLAQIRDALGRRQAAG